MVNTQLFSSRLNAVAADAKNEAGAPAYQLSAKAALAQYAVTGCLNNTFYASAETQLDTVLKLCQTLDSTYIAKVAVYSREAGYMKDMPVLLLAVLAKRSAPELAQIFGRVVDNGKQLRNFVQILRSGVTGRKSLGSAPKRLVQRWLNQANEKQLLNALVGQHPSLADVVKMVHPKPADAMREALFGWLIGRPYAMDDLPTPLAQFERYKQDRSVGVPEVPFQMLTALELSARDWADIADHGGWHMLRMNLNTFARHGVFDLPGMAERIAVRLRDPQAVRRSRVLPYQLLAAWKAAGTEVPTVIRDALQDAMETAVENVPLLQGRVVICPDVSGSMSSAISGVRQGATSAVRCIDVAALITAALLRQNRAAQVLPFATDVVKLELNARDTIFTNAEKLAAVGGGGTNCAAPLQQLLREQAPVDLVVMVSDNESWVDARAPRRGTAMMAAWDVLRLRNPQARLVCLDIQPYASTQVQERADVMNIGGFSDTVFQLIAGFADGSMAPGHWVEVIEQVAL